MRLTIGGPPTGCAGDGNEINGVLCDTVPVTAGLMLVFENSSDQPHSVSVQRTSRTGGTTIPYDSQSFVIPTSERLDVGPFLPQGELYHLDIFEGDIEIWYLSGIRSLRVSAVLPTEGEKDVTPS